MSPPLLPTEVHTLADVERLEAAARRAETPCGDGVMVWRGWGEAGDAGAAAPVVLLHGGAGSWTHWVRNIAPLVAAGRQVWVPDLPGFGDSAPPPTGHDADVLPPWVEAGLAQLVGPTACELVAFSFGSMVAAFLAAAQPARVARLVLVGAPALTADRRPALDLRRWAHLPPGPERRATIRHNLMTMMLADEASAEPLALALHTANLARDRMPLRRLSKTDVLLRTLPAVRCPVHGLWGERDVLYRGAQDIVEPALARAPDFRGLTWLPGAGHWAPFEAPVAFNAALAQALADAGPAAGQAGRSSS
jgi:2-hydroxy-6-oxonona-2,4-dienedioate hydrolase